MLRKIKKYIINNLVREKITPINMPVYEGQLLKGKVALIIGGSGGIGQGIAERFIANGCRVIVSGTNEEKLLSLRNKFGDKYRYIVMDVKEVESLQNKILEASEFFGEIDTFVYSAGVHSNEQFGSVTENTWNLIMDINLKGMYFVCQAAADYMISNKIHGHILNISSASCAKPGWTPYEISKWGVRSMTLGLADKLIKKGIVVNSIAPGPVATAMLGRETGDNLTWQGNPSGRMATIEEIGNLAVFMVSSMGDLVVGDTYFLSGGSGTICIDK